MGKKRVASSSKLNSESEETRSSHLLSAPTLKKSKSQLDEEGQDGVDDRRVQLVQSVQGGLKHHESEKRLIVILEGANLETIKSNKGFGLINVDEHVATLRKLKKDFSNARPDITHQCLLMLMDSPLNRAGLLQVYIRTANNVLIEVHPQTRIPRTFPRFAGLMVQLLHKFSIRASDTSVKLMKVIKNPVTDHLPVGISKVLMSYHSKEVIRPKDLVPEDKSAPMCVVIGAIAKGSVEVDYTERSVCIGNYPLSAALTCTKITDAFEEAWGIF